MKEINWIIQTNLVKQEVIDAIKTALCFDNVKFEEVKIIPFSDSLPDIKSNADVVIFYGSSTLILNAYRDKRFSKGVFYSEHTFNVENYLMNWGARMLNYDSEVTTFSAFAKQRLDDSARWFLRPLSDDKSFSGTVMDFSAIKRMASELKKSNNPQLNTDTRISVSSVKIIEKEWRHFIVNKKVISSSRYMLNGELDISPADIPDELIAFVNTCCNQYVPHDVFVMDTALSNGKFFVVECNCFNGTGFYKHDIVKIIRSVNEYLYTTNIV